MPLMNMSPRDQKHLEHIQRGQGEALHVVSPWTQAAVPATHLCAAANPDSLNKMAAMQLRLHACGTCGDLCCMCSDLAFALALYAWIKAHSHACSLLAKQEETQALTRQAGAVSSGA